MSDIQSISNGTYVIGDTSATNFIAGQGIKIDSPSAGTVRIANDETVLFSSENGEGSSITMSESPSNFERIKVLQGRNTESCNYAEFPGSQNVWQMASWIIASDNSNFICDVQSWSINGNSGTKIIDQRVTFSSTYKKEPGSFTKYVYKVIGINRIGGNA